MKNSFKITLIFGPVPCKTKIKTKKIIYAKAFDEKKKKDLIERLKAKALEENIRFQKRKLPQSFNPVFNGCLFFSDKIKLNDESLIDFANIFFGKLEENFGINVVNYNLIDTKDVTLKENCISKFFDFEIFNYNFNEHKAIKSTFIRAENIRKVDGLAETILARPKFKSKGAGSKSAKNIKKEKGKEKEKEKEKEEIVAETVDTTSVDIRGGIEERVNLISMNWSLLSPSESLPVLEYGEPAEITEASRVRIYFQRPGVRQVIWRFRAKPEINSERPILRVYVDDKMLWYELLDSQSGSRYVIFPDDYELYRTWVEIGYAGEKDEFTFVARSPIWPPDCLFKSLSKINSKKRIPKGISLIGATESIPGGKQLPINLSGSGAGFFGSGAGK